MMFILYSIYEDENANQSFVTFQIEMYENVSSS